MCITHTGVSHTPTGTIAEWLATVLNAVTNRLDQPGGKRIEPGYIDLIAIWSKFAPPGRSEEHTSELQSLMRISYAVFCLTKKKSEYINQQQGKRRTHDKH